MATHQRQESDVLRKSFDTVYEGIDRAQNLDVTKTRKQVERAVQTNRMIVGYSMTAIAIAVLVIVGLFALQMYIDYMRWENRPTFQQRLTAPYGLEGQFPPYLLEAVQVDAQVEEKMKFSTANIEYYHPSEEPASTGFFTQVVKLQSIVPAQIGDFTLLWDRTQPTLLSKCLVQSAGQGQQHCSTGHTPEFLESANFVNSNGEIVSLVMTKFADDEQSRATFDGLYRYSRSIGRIGNFARVDILEVDYFYSRTRNVTSFTWINQNWVLTVNAEDGETLDQFMNLFPLYENNPNLSQFVVEQISHDSGLNKVVPTPEPTIEPALAISGTSGATGLNSASGTSDATGLDSVSGTTSE